MNLCHLNCVLFYVRVFKTGAGKTTTINCLTGKRWIRVVLRGAESSMFCVGCFFFAVLKSLYL